MLGPSYPQFRYGVPRTHGRNVVESLHDPLRRYVKAWLREGHTLRITATVGPNEDGVDIQRVINEVTSDSK